jgi:hypothetical protein
MKSKKSTQEGLHVRGMSRVQIMSPDGFTVVGDSGWCGPNQIVNEGFRQYLCMAIGSVSGSKYITYAALGSGTQPAVADTTLQNELGTRTAVTASTTVAGSKTIRFVQTFAAGWHTNGSAYNISNIGLFNSSTAGTIFAGNTYASSSCASNQAVNTTYDIIFS